MSENTKTAFIEKMLNRMIDTLLIAAIIMGIITIILFIATA